MFLSVISYENGMEVAYSVRGLTGPVTSLEVPL
jgi:hypothetical protein